MRKNLQEYFILLIFSFVILMTTEQGGLLYSDYEVDQIATSDIIASKSITYIDEEATELAKKEALKESKSVYDKDLTIADSTYKSLDKLVEAVDEAKAEENKDTSNSEAEQSEAIKDFDLNKEDVAKLKNVSKEELEKSVSYLQNKIEDLYQVGVREDNLEEIRKSFQEDPNLYLFSRTIRETLAPSISKKIQVNEVLNKAETEKQKQEILNSVNAVYKKIAKGEIVIRKDEKITEEQIHKLEALEIITTDLSLGELLRHYPLILIFTLLFHFYCKKFLLDKINNVRKYAFTFGTIAIVVMLSQLIYNVFWFFVPMMTILIVFALFWGKKFVIPAAIFIGVLISGDDYLYLMMSLVIGLALSFLYEDFRRFTDAIKTGFILGLIIAISYAIITQSTEAIIYLKTTFGLVIAGVLSGVIANGIIPLVENAIGVATIYKLTELNRYDHPILEQLYTKAKGTYEHSRNVGHLCTSASKKIGTNTLLLKVAALYHDLGKIEHPEFFIENSNPTENIHNHTDPLQSAKIILEHPLRSVELCRKHNIPEAVVELIESHHSNSILLHFYQKALEEGQDVDIEQFRYKTSKPKSKEQGILLLADSTEAYSRSLQFSTLNELRKEVANFIYKRVQSGVLDDCELNVKEIKICIEEFATAIYATNHIRIKYQTDKVEGL